MTQNLQPALMGVPEILERTLKLWRDHFTAFVSPLALVMVPLVVFSVWVNEWTGRQFAALLPDTVTPDSLQTLVSSPVFAEQLFALLSISFAALMVVWLGQTLVVGGLMTFAGAAGCQGRTLTFGEAFAALRPRFLRLALHVLLYGALAALLLGVWLLVAAFTCGLGILAAGIPGYFLLLPFIFLLPVLLLEDAAPGESWWRGIALGRQRFWAAIQLYAALAVLGFFAGLVFALIQQVLVSVLPAAEVPIVLIVQSAVTVLLAPLSYLGQAVMYCDLRARREGGLTAAPPPAPRVLMREGDWSVLLLFTIGVAGMMVIYTCASTLALGMLG